MRGNYGYFEEKRLGKADNVKLFGRLLPFARPYALLLVAAVSLAVGITLLDLALPYVTKVAIDDYIVPRIAPQSGDADTHFFFPVDPENETVRRLQLQHPHAFQKDGAKLLADRRQLPPVTTQVMARLRAKDLEGILRMTALFLALVLLNFGLNFVQMVLMEYTGQMIMHDLRVRLFDHIQRLPITFFTRNPVGRLVTRATNDVQNMQELFTSIIVFVFKDTFLIVGITVVLLGIHWQLALIALSVAPLIVLVTIYFALQAREVYRTLRIKVAEINTRFAETINGIKVIQLFCRQRHNYRRFATLNHENYTAGIRQVHVFAVFMPVIEMLGATAMALIIYYGGLQVYDETITIGVLVVFISYMRMFFRPIRDIAEKYNVMQNAMASAERIFLILDDEHDLASSLPPVRSNGKANLSTITSLSFQGVNFSYRADVPVLRNLSFRIDAGQTLAVVGPTGAGKTSMINLILRFYDPDSGSIRINARDIRTYDLATLRSRIALVSQEPFLFSDSIADNVLEGNPAASAPTLDRILSAAHCGPLVQKLPQGPATVLSEGGGSISSGERQLLSIARAIARDPQLIILDEATSYVDSQTEQQIQAAMANLMAGRTTILVAHRLSTARGADNIIVLKNGAIIESGPHTALMAKQGFYYRLNQLQG